MRILYLHQFFITRAGVGGTRSYEFARRFVARGHGVRMVTAAEGNRTIEGIEVVGVRRGYSDYVSATAVSYPRRMLAFARFALAATRAALRGPRPDVVYATSPHSPSRCPPSPPPRAGARRSSSRCATCGPRRRSRWARSATRWPAGSPAPSSTSSTAARARVIALSPGSAPVCWPPAFPRSASSSSRTPLTSICSTPRRRRAGRPLHRLLLRHDGRGQRPQRGRRGGPAAARGRLRPDGGRQAPRRAPAEAHRRTSPSRARRARRRRWLRWRRAPTPA